MDDLYVLGLDLPSTHVKWQQTLFNLISVELVMHLPITSRLNNHELTRSSPKWCYLPTTPFFFFNKIQNFLGHFVFRTPKVIVSNLSIPFFFLYTLCHAYIFFPRNNHAISPSQTWNTYPNTTRNTPCMQWSKPVP